MRIVFFLICSAERRSVNSQTYLKIIGYPNLIIAAVSNTKQEWDTKHSQQRACVSLCKTLKVGGRLAAGDPAGGKGL